MVMEKKASLGLWISLAIIGAVVVIILALVVSAYNSLISANENVNQAWADVQTQYQRRADLIPNLIEVTKGAKDFELAAIDKVTTARATYLGAEQTGTVQEQIEAAKGMDRALNDFLLVFENYPDLKATESFRDLSAALEGSENRVAVARTRYNEVVAIYNKAIKRFPGVIFASMFGFSERPYFEATPGVEIVPVVDFT